MARPIWTGALSFGLVSLPVKLYAATRSHTIRFHQLERGTGDRVRNRRVNERTGEDVRPDDIVKGLDVGDDQYVVVEPEELDDIAPGRSKALEISGFVDLDEVEPIYFDRTYYLGPQGEEHQKVYALLRDALAESHRAGIATFVMRGKEYLVAVKAEEGILALHTLHWADEVRDPGREVPELPGRTEPGKGELRTALQLVETLTVDWDPEEYEDTFQESVQRLVDAKKRGETVAKAEKAPESTNVVDLMDALRASVDDAEGRGGKKGSRRGRRSAKRSGSAAKQERGGGTDAALEELTKDQLYERATEAGVRGRSRMTRDQLLAALAEDDGRSRAKAS
ncbi:Ku protein [Streptomyces sp. P38-E01]|uniref:Non-homologous end joining protein Ku n=1 Tax=Streptomyces tardus TaxID=2780544 RepID=A0A949N6X4_9ACTN|nr:Ku protein [Streptomyces tardus]MBU7596433.1 Ku protein [Streptomyces tardus]